jgi:signal transduction histidine kinase
VLLPERTVRSDKTPAMSSAGAFGEKLLLQNVLWFCRLRWVAVGILVAFGILGLFAGFFRPFGFEPRADWPFATAGLLSVCNVAYLVHASRLPRSGALHSLRINLWCQIVVDLVILTADVHFVGSIETFVPFAYVFHIVLACIFFPRSYSLFVSTVASFLYATCVVGERIWDIPRAGIHEDAVVALRAQMPYSALVFDLSLVLASWFVVWYLASHLSLIVRRLDNELAETNDRLLKAQEERAAHMLRTTHELKAPFAAIQANTQLLLKGYCGPLSAEALDAATRISQRCRRLTSEILDMLRISNLRSTLVHSLVFVQVDLPELLSWCVAQIEPTARERAVTVDRELAPARVTGVVEHLKMLFENILSNAVTYSRPGGRVSLRCSAAAPGHVLVTIEDDGIGIAPEKLPRIFDEYYRTNEAVSHNSQSSGLGLTIVRHVAESHRIGIRVESRLGEGTKFELTLRSS